MSIPKLRDAFLFMQVFFSNKFIEDQILVDDQEHQHLNKVLRKKVGDHVFVCNGKGLMVEAEILASSKKETILKKLEVVIQLERDPNNLILAVAPTKNIDRYEWMLEKAIEIGVRKVIPFYSQNSERRKLRLERLQGIALAAMKQSKAVFLPEIIEPISFDKLLQVASENRFIAYVRETSVSIQTEFSKLSKAENCLVLIGPEGGFTHEEANLAIKNGFVSISLGEKRLRTETAGVFTAAAHQLLTK